MTTYYAIQLYRLTSVSIFKYLIRLTTQCIHHSTCTLIEFLIQSNNYVSDLLSMQVYRWRNWHPKQRHGFEWVSSALWDKVVKKWRGCALLGVAKMLLCCVKTIVRSSRSYYIGLACLKKLHSWYKENCAV